MRTILGGAVVAALAFAGAAVPAQADSNVQCPLGQATRSIVNPLPPGWQADAESGNFSGNRVEGPVGSQILVCTYGAAGSIQRAAPAGESCTRLPNRRFRCITIPPPAPIVVAQGQIVLTDGASADLDGGGAPDIRLRQGGQLLRVLEPRNGARFSPRGTSTPNFNTCNTAQYSNAAIPLVQLPIGAWLCVSTNDGNIARMRLTSIQGFPQLPLPINVVFNYTTWSQPTGGGGGPLPSAPVYSTGLLEIPQTFQFDLDNGQVGGGGNADFWFQAQTSTQLFINPRNGAQIGVGNKTNRGYVGCANEVYSPNRVALNTLAPGNYICAVTSDGRVAQFRINAILGGTPKTLRIGYTTWE
jgi:hypothetical protein